MSADAFSALSLSLRVAVLATAINAAVGIPLAGSLLDRDADRGEVVRPHR